MFKKIFTITSLCAGFMFSVGPATVKAAPQQYSLDSSHTTVAFLIDHVGFAKTLGLFTDVSGSLTYDQETNTVSDVTITVATKSVDTANKARDKHVRNKDFLNVKKHPELIFTASSATLNADGQVDIAGDLQLLGQTQPLVLTATLNKSEKYPFGHKSFTLGVSARGSLQRSAYGMSYGVANALVGDAIELIIEVEANQNK